MINRDDAEKVPVNPIFFGWPSFLRQLPIHPMIYRLGSVFGEVLFSLNSDLDDLPDRRHGRTEVASLPLRLKKSNEIVIKVI